MDICLCVFVKSQANYCTLYTLSDVNSVIPIILLYLSVHLYPYLVNKCKYRPT